MHINILYINRHKLKLISYIFKEEIVRSEEEIDKKKEETNQMLLYLLVMNSTGDSMLEYVFEAENYTDFIYRYAIVTQMTDYNQQLMNELENKEKGLSLLLY